MLSLSLFLHGLPLQKSTNLKCWPILISVQQLPNKAPMLVGIFSGSMNIEQYLRSLVNDLNDLYQTRLVVYNRIISVKMLYFVADTPARALVKGKK